MGVHDSTAAPADLFDVFCFLLVLAIGVLDLAGARDFDFGARAGFAILGLVAVSKPGTKSSGSNDICGHTMSSASCDLKKRTTPARNKCDVVVGLLVGVNLYSDRWPDVFTDA